MYNPFNFGDICEEIYQVNLSYNSMPFRKYYYLFLGWATSYLLTEWKPPIISSYF